MKVGTIVTQTSYGEMENAYVLGNDLCQFIDVQEFHIFRDQKDRKEWNGLRTSVWRLEKSDQLMMLKIQFDISMTQSN